MKRVSVSTPGKIHFLGEHVVVYGKPAVLAAVDRRCRVTIDPVKRDLIEIVSKNLSVSQAIPPRDIIKKALDAKASWVRFIEKGDISYLTRITKEELDYAFLAVGETLLFYDEKLTSGVQLTIDSDIPVGAGLGSSAALAVAIASALTLYLGKPLDKKIIHRITFAIEQRKHGRPSGGDPATCLYGGLVWFRKETDDLKIIEPIPFTFDTRIAENFSTIHTGKPNESTGEMIAIAKTFMDKNPKTARYIFDDQEKLTRLLLGAIRQNDEGEIMDIMKKGEHNLERIGVVSPFVRRIIREIERSGGAAKISGGGGKTKGTGMLLVYHPKKSELKKIVQKYELLLNTMKLGVEGLRVES